MCKKGKQIFLSQDVFGHPVTLNFNKKGDTYKTNEGACLSILLRCFMLLFLIVKLRVFAEKSDNVIT